MHSGLPKKLTVTPIWAYTLCSSVMGVRAEANNVDRPKTIVPCYCSHVLATILCTKEAIHLIQVTCITNKWMYNVVHVYVIVSSIELQGKSSAQARWSSHEYIFMRFLNCIPTLSWADVVRTNAHTYMYVKLLKVWFIYQRYEHTQLLMWYSRLLRITQALRDNDLFDECFNSRRYANKEHNMIR